MDRLEKLRELLKANAADNFVEHAIALEFIKIGNDAEARMHFERILEREPAYIGSYYHLGKLLERTGDAKLAIEWYEKGMAQAKKAGEIHAYGELKGAWEELSF